MCLGRCASRNEKPRWIGTAGAKDFRTLDGYCRQILSESRAVTTGIVRGGVAASADGAPDRREDDCPKDEAGCKQRGGVQAEASAAVPGNIAHADSADGDRHRGKCRRRGQFWEQPVERPRAPRRCSWGWGLHCKRRGLPWLREYPTKAEPERAASRRGEQRTRSAREHVRRSNGQTAASASKLRPSKHRGACGAQRKLEGASDAYASPCCGRRRDDHVYFGAGWFRHGRSCCG